MAAQEKSPIRRDWWSKTLAGALLGLLIAMAAAAILSQLMRATPLPVRGQLMMWLVPPVWLGFLGGVYFFKSGLRAWLWLGTASALCWAIVLAFQSFARAS